MNRRFDAARVLLAEDDAVLAQPLVLALQREGFAPRWVTDGVDAYAAVCAGEFDALLLDLGLPGLCGLDLLHRLRASHPSLPVLIVSGLGDPRDRVRGFELGADDVVPKPFDTAELVARLRAVLRRSGATASQRLKAGDVQIDLHSHQVLAAGEPVWLSGREYAVLKLLMTHAGRSVSREQIEAELYGFGDGPAANAVDVFVSSLRKKLGRELIRTFRGGGYAVSR